MGRPLLIWGLRLPLWFRVSTVHRLGILIIKFWYMYIKCLNHCAIWCTTSVSLCPLMYYVQWQCILWCAMSESQCPLMYNVSQFLYAQCLYHCVLWRTMSISRCPPMYYLSQCLFDVRCLYHSIQRLYNIVCYAKCIPITMSLGPYRNIHVSYVSNIPTLHTVLYIHCTTHCQFVPLIFGSKVTILYNLCYTG